MGGLEEADATPASDGQAHMNRTFWTERNVFVTGVTGLLGSWLAEELLAREANVHPVYLARAFRRFFRHSVGEYVRILRMREACRRLADSDEPLADVSLATGFFDQSHLTRHFKRQLGTTPARFRRLVRAT